MGLIITEEHVIKDAQAPAKCGQEHRVRDAKPGTSIEAFQRYWREVHGPLAAQIATVRRYVQSHTRLAAYDGGRSPSYDGAAITLVRRHATRRRPAPSTPRTGGRGELHSRPPFIITRARDRSVTGPPSRRRGGS
jgi:uncharacterized protein (TIGR02118 family)